MEIIIKKCSVCLTALDDLFRFNRESFPELTRKNGKKSGFDYYLSANHEKGEPVFMNYDNIHLMADVNIVPLVKLLKKHLCLHWEVFYSEIDNYFCIKVTARTGFRDNPQRVLVGFNPDEGQLSFLCDEFFSEEDE